MAMAGSARTVQALILVISQVLAQSEKGCGSGHPALPSFFAFPSKVSTKAVEKPVQVFDVTIVLRPIYRYLQPFALLWLQLPSC